MRICGTRSSVIGFCCTVLLLLGASHARATLIHTTDTLLGNAYDIWQEPADTTWRFACQTPCPIPLATLQSAANGFLAAKQQLLGLSAIDTLSALRPVDIFFESNSICPYYPSVSGYSATYLPYGGSQEHAYACLFLWNYQQAGTINYFTAQSAGLASSQTLIVHEYAHSIFFRRHQYSYEDFVRYWSYRISGTVPLPDGMCSQNLIVYSAPMIYELCHRYAAGDSDIRAALTRMDQFYQQGIGYNFPTTSVSQLRQAFDEQFGLDTRGMFLDLGYAPQEAGGTYSPVLIGSNPPMYQYSFTNPNGSFLLSGVTNLSAPVKLEKPSCVPYAPFINFRMAFDLVSPTHHEGDGLPVPQFGQPLTLTYSFSHAAPEQGVNAANYRFYRATASCGEPGLGWQEWPAQIDLINKKLTATIVQGGTYALFQPDVIFKNGFQ